MSDHNPTSATADLSVLAHLRSGLVNAAGVTDFADQGVLLPLAAGIALLLALSGWRRGALAWTAAIGGTLALILLLKLRFFACGHFLPDSGVGNPSGHTAAAAAVYGGLVAMILRFIWDDGRWAFFCAVTTGVLLAVVIGSGDTGHSLDGGGCRGRRDRHRRRCIIRRAGGGPFACCPYRTACADGPGRRGHALWFPHAC